MRMSLAVMHRWAVDVDKLKEYKRREGKGKRVREMVNKQIKSFEWKNTSGYGKPV